MDPLDTMIGVLEKKAGEEVVPPELSKRRCFTSRTQPTGGRL